MAEELQETVERLQSRLLENLEPRKLVKTLKRLGELPITVDILVETGVGKTVNSFRKHDLAGGAAKDLVAKWKELVPQSADRSSKSHAKEATRSHAHSRGSEASYVRGHRLPRDPSPEEEHSCRVEEDDHVEEDDRERDGENDEMEEEERGYHTNYSPSPPQHQHYSPPRLAHGSGLRGGYQSEGYESPEPEPEPSPPPRKEARHHVKPHKEPSKNHHQHSSHGDHSKDKERLRDEDRRQRHTQTQSGDRGGGSGDGGKGEGKKRSADGEPQQSGAHKAAKHSRHSTQHDGKKERDKEEKERDKEEKERDKEEKKKGGSDGRPRVAPKDSPPLVKELVKEEDFDEFETPTMSFESFLTYDAPAVIKKKKKPSSSSSSSSSHCRPSHASSSSSSHHTRAPPPAASSSSSKSSSSKASKANGTKTSKKGESGSASAPPSEKRKRVVEAVQLPTLPDIPLPAIQPNYRPLPSLDITPLSPQRRKVPVSNDEEDAGFTGKRLSSKMSVYSGAKTTYLPKMMSLYEQCIRVLQNNVDSIDEVGGVPFEILEPVLDRCTPEQLYRIEQCNQSFIEESDELWRRHCQRDFKRAAPQEYESWRELYLRLHDEREERLRMLTQNIRSANENKPKGRQVKMAFVNSVAKAPRDVQRRQAKFGTASGSTASSTAASAPIKVRPVVMYSPLPSAQAPSSSSSQNSPPHSSSSAPTGGAGPGGHARSVAWDSKPQVKKIAPMMAKTIKAFKNRFSRR